MMEKKNALDLLIQLKEIIEIHEQTISNQAEKIKQLEEENLQLRNELSLGKYRENEVTKESNTISETTSTPVSPPPTESKSGTENLSSIAKRSSSFQRKHLEEQDVRTRTESYELSSDLFDKQIEVLRNRYGGPENSERAARIIQEAYRRYRMRLNFRKIRKSKTRRLTLENKMHISEYNKDEDNSKVEVVELVHSFNNESGSDSTVTTDDKVSHESKEINQSDTIVQPHEEEEIFDKLFEGKRDDDNIDPDEPLTPTATDIKDSYELVANSEENVAKVLSEIAMPGILSGKDSVTRRRRKNRHGYESVILPKKDPIETKEGDDDEGTLKRNQDLRRSVASSSTSRYSDMDSYAWQRVGSELSLTSYDNEPDEDSLRSSDTASIASGQSEFSNSLMSETYQRRSTLSTRGSWHIDSNNDVMRKRLYRIGLNLFNKKPEKGVEFLVEHNFIARTAPAVASFLLNRKGLSRQMVGEYLGNTQKRFNQEVLDSVCELMDFSDLEIDEALRQFQHQIKVQGEAQKVDRLVETFSQRYCTCNPKLAESLKNPDAIFILAFAIIMLNTDLHSPNMKREKRMTEDDFVKNLRGVDGGDDLDEVMLRNTYNRLRENELKTDDDHVTQVLNVEKNIIGKKPVLAVPHRRLVCYCRLYQVTDPAKPQKVGLHQRAVFLFNDLLLITKVLQKKKHSTTYGYKLSLPLQGMNVLLFETTFYMFGIRLINTMDNKVLVTFNAPNEHDRNKFVTDLRESVNEVQQMENYRIGAELERAQLPADGRNSLTRETKVLSASMHNLNETPASHASIPPFMGMERPASMYLAPANKNNNNINGSSKTGEGQTQNSIHASTPDLQNSGQTRNKKSEHSVFGSWFKVGGKKEILSPQSTGFKKETLNNTEPPQITLTLSEV